MEEFLKDNAYIIAGIVAFQILMHYSIKSYPLFVIVNFPGTVLHEATHWIVSLFTGGYPMGFNVWPRRETVGNKVYYHLGHVVSYNVRWYNAALIGLAPLLLVGLAYYIWQNCSVVGYKRFFCGTLVAYLAAAGIPSTQDLKVAIHGSIVAIWIGIMIWGLFFSDYIHL